MFALSFWIEILKPKTSFTLTDVARLAGVSAITVSRVLRNSGPISPQTRERVMSAVRRIGYVHNRVAGSLATSRSNLVGVILPSLSNNVFPQVMAGIDSALAQTGFQPVVGVTDYDLDKEETLVRSMLAWKPAAMILAGLTHTIDTAWMLANAGIRVVEIMDIGKQPIDLAIGLSHRDVGIATAQYLIERGYRRFGYVGHDLSRDDRARARHAGLRERLAAAGLALEAEVLTGEPSAVGGGRQALKELIGRQPACDVVVFSNDDMAVGGVFHCMEAGIELRSGLALFGFNGLDVGQALPRPLSTILSKREEIGQLAVRNFLAEPDRPAATSSIDTGFEIIPGETA